MSLRQDSLDLRRAPGVSNRSTTPAASPRKQTATPRKALRPSATPGGSTPGRTPSMRTRPLPPGRSRAAPRGGVQSEPSSPRGAGSGSLLGADALADPLLDELLPPGEDAFTASPAASDNIKVYVRVRSPNAREVAAGAPACVSIQGGGRSLVLAEAGRPEPLVATFDRVLGPEAGQEAVYGAVGAQMVDNVMAGFNSSVFVYGQTGAGKTYTITGDVERREDGALAEECGLSLRVFRQLFDRITDEENGGVSFTVKCSYCECYNEEITDLLAPAATGLAIRDGDQHRGVYVEGLSEHVAVNADDVMRLIQRGAANRHTAATRMNERSSRSHSVFIAVVEAHEEQADSGVTNVRFAKLNLIDLAGSERVGKSGATGDQLTEAKNINKSLTTLGRVVTALTERQQHVPYRDSRLTFLLKESLGGNSKTCIVACVSPCEDSTQETHSTLTFVANAKRIRNKAVVNQDTLGDVKALQAENARLQRELAKREDVMAAELRAELAAAQGAAAAAEERVAAAEGRQQQLEAALNQNHAALQQRNAELALVKKEVEDTKATCTLLQKDREQLIDHNAALAERLDSLTASLERLQGEAAAAKADAAETKAAAAERCEAALAAQHSAEDEARVLRHDSEQLQRDLGRASAQLTEEQAAAEEAERSNRALKREREQLLSDLRRERRDLSDVQEMAARQEERYRGEVAGLHEALAARTAQLAELEGKLAGESVCTAKYRRMVGEIGKLIDWAQSTSPAPPILGGRTSPAGYSSLLHGSRLSFGGGSSGLGSPLGNASNQLNQLRASLSGSRGGRQAPPSTSPSKRQLQVASPAGRSPLCSPSKMR